MKRREFFRSMLGGVAAAAAVRTFPFRVYSFPSEIVVAESVGPSFASILFHLRCEEIVGGFLFSKDIVEALREGFSPCELAAGKIRETQRRFVELETIYKANSTFA